MSLELGMIIRERELVRNKRKTYCRGCLVGLELFKVELLDKVCMYHYLTVIEFIGSKSRQIPLRRTEEAESARDEGRARV